MKKKTLTAAIALVLIVALAVGATYAYLTAKTGTVTNTFVVGKVIDPGDEKTRTSFWTRARRSGAATVLIRLTRPSA